jgi:hypothetical protein
MAFNITRRRMHRKKKRQNKAKRMVEGEFSIHIHIAAR